MQTIPAELPLPAEVSPSARLSPARTESGSSLLAFLLSPFGALLVLVAATILVYAPALDGEFLWDDHYLVRDNAFIRSPLFGLEVFRHTLFNDESNFYRPAQLLTYLCDYWWWAAEPFGYHLTNVLIHAGDGFLLFALLRRTLPALVPPVVRRSTTDRTAFVVALLWVLHPVHSAAVAYISGRADSLAMGFCLAAWLLCERVLDAQRPLARAAWGAGAFACFLLGLCSKEIAFVWLVLFAAWLFVVRPAGPRADGVARSPRWGQLAVVAGGLLAIGCYLYLRHLPNPAPQPPPAVFATMPSKGTLMLRALGDYGRLMVFPGRLFMERQVFAAPGLSNPGTPLFYHSLAAAGVLVIAAFIAGAWLPGCGQLLRRCGAAWFLIGFLPISNLFRLNASVAEHWLYLPSIGFLLFLAGAALDLPFRRLLPAWRGLATACLLLAVTALGIRTWWRAHDWTNRLIFYRQTTQDGGDVPRSREGLALSYMDAGKKTSDQAAAAAGNSPRQATLAASAKESYEAAVKLLERIVAQYPHAYSARVNLATVLVRLERKEEARTILEALAATLVASSDRRAGPNEFAVTVHSLDTLEPSGDPAWTAQRRSLLDRASSRFPESWELVLLRIMDAEQAQDPTGALALAADFADRHWWHAAARIRVGRCLRVLGRTDDALVELKKASRLDVHDAEALSLAAATCLDRGRIDDAVAFQQNAVDRQPSSLRQHLFLAGILERAGRMADASHERETASRLYEAN